MHAHNVLPGSLDGLRGYVRLTAFPDDMMFRVPGYQGYQIKQVQVKQWEQWIVVRGYLGYLVWCREGEAREEQSDFILWHDTSVLCLDVSHTSSTVTVAKASAIVLGIGALSIDDPVAGE